MRVIILLAVSAALSLGCAGSREADEVYLIPRGFSGQIAVVFGVDKGEREVLEEGRRVYNIPEDGILITRAKFNDAWHAEEYFFVEGAGRTPIPKTTYGRPEELKEKGLGEGDAFACCGGASSAGGEYHYSLLYVGTREGLNAGEKDYAGALDFHGRVRTKLEKVLGGRIPD